MPTERPQPDGRLLRVLLVAPDTTGGIGQHVRTVAQGLVERGHAVTLCAPRPTLERLGFPPGGSASVDTVAMKVGRASTLVHLRQLAALSRTHDVTHAHGVRVGAQAALAHAAPLVVTWHNAPLGGATHRVAHALLERICARRASLVLGASADLVGRAHAAGARDARPTAVVAPDRVPVVVRPGRELGDPPTVLAIARLHAQKRLDLLVQVAARWPDGPDRPRFLVAGDGPLLPELRRQVDAARAPVTFLGARDDVSDLLRDADVVVLPSDWEARPLVAQEALRAGVPLVATDVGGVRELVGDAAVLVPAGSAPALEQALRRILAEPALRAELQHAGPARSARWPTVQDMLDDLLRCYLEVLPR